MTYKLSTKLSVALAALLLAALLLSAALGAGAVAHADGLYDGEMILEASVQTTATEKAPGLYRSIAAGDTFTVTYKLVKNDGMADGMFTPSYDKDAFELTSFAVDTEYWSLFNNYAGKSAAQYIADRNEKYAAGEISDFRLTFMLSFADVTDPDGILSDHFITIKYTARTDLTAPATAAHYAFGFNASYTEASRSPEKLLSLKLKVGEESGQPVTEALGADTFSFAMRSALAISIAEDQTISFQYNDQTGEYYLDLDDIALTFDEGDGAAYRADEGAAITYVFYRKNPETGDLEPILDEQTQEPALPSLPDLTNIYVKATAAGTDHFDAANSGDPVHVAIAPIYLAKPDLRIYDTQHGDQYATLDADLTAAVSATYGTKFTLKEVVNEEEVAFDAPATATQSATGLNFTYLSSEDGNAPYAPEGRPLGIGVATGVHTVKISTPDPVFVKFAGTDLSEIVIDLTVTKATIYLDTVLDEEYQQITYGDPVPPADAFSIEVRGILETGAAHDLILGIVEENATVTSDAPYHNKTQFAPTSSVGTYVYYATSDVDLRNYVVVRGNDAVLTVEQLTLTLTAQYDGNVVTFSASGLLPDDSLQYIYFVKTLPSTTYVMQTSNTYTAQYADAGATVVACVRATPVTGYPGSNYAQGELTLEPVYNVFFRKGTGFDAATGNFATQQRFKDCLATRPADPAFPGYEFAGWTLAGEPFDFTTPITSNTVLTANWIQVTATFKFRAINTSANLLTGDYYALNWDEQAAAFTIATTLDPTTNKQVAADTAEGIEFDFGEAIPTKTAIKGFRVKRWWSVIPQVAGDPVVTEVTAFASAVSIDVAPGAYYLAEMELDVGVGDVNGDGSVTTLDLITMKRYLVDTTYVVIATEQEAWDVALREDDNGDYFFIFAWDSNGDTYRDTRDLVTIRAALATGYGYVVVTDATADGVYCEKQQVARADARIYDGRVNVVTTVAALDDELLRGRKAILGADLAFEEVTALYENDLFIDLGGHSITAARLEINTTGSITVVNGKLNVTELVFHAEDGVTVTDVTDPADEDAAADGTNQNFGW